MDKVDSLKGLFERELRLKNVLEENIKYILDLITEMDSDSNLNRMDNDAFDKLEERGLKDVFDEICDKYGIKWNHSNEPDR